MGCVSSKKIRCDSPNYDDVCSTSCAGGRRQRSRHLPASASLPAHVEAPLQNLKEEAVVVVKVEAAPEEKKHDERSEKSRELKKGASQKKAVLSVAQHGRMTEAELAAAGWPSWLTAVAADAIDGWVPLKAESYERLDKVAEFLLLFIPNHLKIQPFYLQEQCRLGREHTAMCTERAI